MKTSESTSQLASSASALGAAILGFGVGIKWGQSLTDYGLIILFVGAVIHVAGMYVAQMRTKPARYDKIARVLWLSAWVCLVIITVAFIYLTWFA